MEKKMSKPRKTSFYAVLNIEEEVTSGYRYLVVEVLASGELAKGPGFYFADTAIRWCHPVMEPAAIDDIQFPADEMPF